MVNGAEDIKIKCNVNSMIMMGETGREVRVLSQFMREEERKKSISHYFSNFFRMSLDFRQLKMDTNFQVEFKEECSLIYTCKVVRE